MRVRQPSHPSMMVNWPAGFSRRLVLEFSAVTVFYRDDFFQEVFVVSFKS